MILRVERSEYEIRTLRNEITRQRAVIAEQTARLASMKTHTANIHTIIKRVYDMHPHGKRSRNTYESHYEPRAYVMHTHGSWNIKWSHTRS